MFAILSEHLAPYRKAPNGKLWCCHAPRRWVWGVWPFFALLSVPVLAADLVCTVPAGAVTRATQLCEELRLERRIRVSEWSNDICATEILRIGLLEVERRVTERDQDLIHEAAVKDTLSKLKTDFPRVDAVVCGDGIVDTEFGEECDPPNHADCLRDCTVRVDVVP